MYSRVEPNRFGKETADHCLRSSVRRRTGIPARWGSDKDVGVMTVRVPEITYSGTVQRIRKRFGEASKRSESANPKTARRPPARKRPKGTPEKNRRVKRDPNKFRPSQSASEITQSRGVQSSVSVASTAEGSRCRGAEEIVKCIHSGPHSFTRRPDTD